MLCFFGTDQNQTGNKLQMENRVTQIAMADSVIKGVYCPNIAQNLLPPLITLVPFDQNSL